MSNLVHGLTFRAHKFYTLPYGKIYHGLVNLIYDCDMKLGQRVLYCTQCFLSHLL